MQLDRLQHKNSQCQGNPNQEDGTTKILKFLNFTPLFLNLHWLPVEWKNIFKIAVAMLKTLHDFVPSYITELIRPYKPERTVISLGGWVGRSREGVGHQVLNPW